MVLSMSVYYWHEIYIYQWKKELKMVSYTEYKKSLLSTFKNNHIRFHEVLICDLPLYLIHATQTEDNPTNARDFRIWGLILQNFLDGWIGACPEMPVEVWNRLFFCSIKLATVTCRTAIKALFLYFNVCWSVKFNSISYSITSISILTNWILALD